MKKVEIEINLMCRAIISLFESFVALWEGKTTVEESVNKLKAYDVGVEVASFQQMNSSTKGITIDKKKLRKLMISVALVVISKIRPYAKRTNNNELLVAVDFSESDLSHGKEADCVSRCSVVLSKGREFLTSLASYKLTESDLVALEATIEPFRDIAEKSKVTASTREAATEKIEMLTTLTRQELQILDDLVKSQMPEDFYTTYINLR